MKKEVHYYVLETGTIPCGCVALEHAEPKRCYLERLSVLPEFRRRGFGTALVNHVLMQCRSLGGEFVQIGIISADTELKQWYENLGFTETHTTTFAHLPFEVAFMIRILKNEL